MSYRISGRRFYFTTIILYFLAGVIPLPLYAQNTRGDSEALEEKPTYITQNVKSAAEQKKVPGFSSFPEFPSFPKERFIYQFESFITYTIPTIGPIPHRHTYLWGDLFTQFFLNEYNSFSNIVRISKQSISRSLDNFPFKITFFPVFTFNGSFASALLKEKNSILGENVLDVKIGSILDFTPSKGLIYSEFTGLGLDLNWDLLFGSLELSYISYGYQGFDDVVSGYIYTPKRYFGLGVLAEFNTTLGTRFIPEINAEISKKFSNWEFNLFGEMGVHYLPNSSSKAVDFTDEEKFIIVPPDLTLEVGLLSDGFHINANTLLGLAGFEFSYNKKSFGDIKALLRGEYRYYGRDHGNFYFEPRSGALIGNPLSSRSGFEFYTDVRSDEKHNNQPYNFFLRRGYNHGIYIRTEIEMNPLYLISPKFNLKARNEYLLVLNKDFDISGDPIKTNTWQDVFSVIFTYFILPGLDINLKVSNILIGPLERMQPIVLPNVTLISSEIEPVPTLLRSSGKNILLDIYLHFKF